MKFIKFNLLNYNSAGMRDFFNEIKEPPFRAQQVMQWIHRDGVCDFSLMTNLPKSLRESLETLAEIKMPEVLTQRKSIDGTCKWLLKLECGNSIETVFIPEVNRGTLCISSQIGCSLNCSFCSTGKQGFNRNLTTAEIISQLWLAVRLLSDKKNPKERMITNVVMMGMGEPLLNFTNVVTAMDIMLDDFAYGLSKYRVTLSTAGIVPIMLKLQQASPVALAVSLHAPNDELRNQLVPLNKKYPLAQLIATCKTYFPKESKRQVTFEYVMLNGINDQPEHAKQLVNLLHNVPAKVNLIPFNPFPLTQYERSSQATIDNFKQCLLRKGINTITRRTRGVEIDAACGQLAGDFKDKTIRSVVWQQKNSKCVSEL